MTVSLLLAYLISVAVALTTILTAVLGIVLLYLGLTYNFILLLLAAPLIGLAWISRPRFPRLALQLERDGTVVHLRRLADDVARAVGTRPVDGVVVTPDFNAAVTASGWRRSTVLLVGLPLFCVLSAQERVAVLAHEFAHFANSDPRRGLVIGNALMSLAAWHDVLAPTSLGESVVMRLSTDSTARPFGTSDSPGLLGLGTFVVNAVMQALSLVPLAVFRTLQKLTARQNQRAEYLADALAANVAGSQALVSFFDKMHIRRAYESAVSVQTNKRWRNQSLWDDLQARLREFPDSERRRFRLVDRATAASLDLTHPPTALRIDAIAARGIVPASFVLGEAQNQQVDDDLHGLLARTQDQVIDRYLDSIYAG